MRCFIAIELPSKIKQEMERIQEVLRNSRAVDASWTRPEGMHLTLKFLGDVPEQRLPEITSSLRSGLEKAEQLRLEGTGVGTFPDPKNARVVWIGVSGETARLAILQSAVEDVLAAIGFDQEKRAFFPHLTLCRIKFIRSREAWLKALENVSTGTLPSFAVEKVSVMKSELRPSGAVYTEIGAIALN